MNIGIDHGYYAIKTRHFSFPAGISEYSHEPYTLQNTLEYGGKFYVCGTGRQPILRNKMENDNYYLLTLAAIAKEFADHGVSINGVNQDLKPTMTDPGYDGEIQQLRIVTHLTDEVTLRETVEAVRTLDFVTGEPSILRVLD